MKKTMILAQIVMAAGALMVSLDSLAAGTHMAGHGADHGVVDLIGKAGTPADVTRTIAVDMTDAMRFTPDHFDVQAGETVRIKVTNSGKIRHEMVLGTEADLDGHYQMMLKDPGMRHEEANAVSLEAGKTGEIIWKFDKGGKVSFACLEPGHYPAGMKGAVSVVSSK